MESLVKVATCNLNQWAMDFDTNLRNVEKSIRQAKQAGARLRVGPELELTGYGCEDHFLEQDTFFHSWKSLLHILDSDLTDNIVCDIGMPVLHRGIRYNCRVILLNRKIVLIRPKIYLADDGNYRESRWFTCWSRIHELDSITLPSMIYEKTGQRSSSFGVAIVECHDCTIACETCEELFTPLSPHINLCLNGVEIICNGSGSHHKLRKLQTRANLICNATAKSGGAYLYANQQGCDGGRLYYDGCAFIAVDGHVHAQGSQFSVHDVEVVYAVLDLEAIRAYRGAISSRSKQATQARTIERVKLDFCMCSADFEEPLSMPSIIRFHSVEEEIALGPSCWMWDYLRRSGATGFFLALSGGADSAATAVLVGVMCRSVVEALHSGDKQVERDVRNIIGKQCELPKTGAELAQHILCTMYMGTVNSSDATNHRAASLAKSIGAYHMHCNIDTIVSAFLSVFTALTKMRPFFRSDGGTNVENLALQNIQARSRMVLSFLFAQLIPWTRAKNGFLLVLGSANVDEALRGYMTKYDCSSADINPIGGLSKQDLKRFLQWSIENMDYDVVRHIVDAAPTAELEPITPDYTQSDEVDMAMSYEELGIFGRLRNKFRCGPLSMYERLRHIWLHMSPICIAEKVKKFFFFYSTNRHKLTVLTPSYHAEDYSPDDNRFDHRQFLYNTQWPAQFRELDRVVSIHDTKSRAKKLT